MSIGEWNNSNVQETQAEGTSVGFSLWSIVARHPVVILFCLLMAGGLGALYYTQIDRTYESVTSLLIETKKPPALGDEIEARPSYEKTLMTHAEIVQSRSLIIKKAVADHNLDQLESLANKSNVVGAIVNDLAVEYEDPEALVLKIRYEGSNAKDCQRVLNAINETYGTYLEESSRDVGTETVALITSAHRDLTERLQLIESKYATFQKAEGAQLLWRNGQGVNVHQERQAELEKVRAELMVQRSILDARLQASQRAAADPQSREALLFEAIKELNPRQENDEPVLGRTEDTKETEQMRIGLQNYLDLVLKESELAQKFGADHPELIAIRRQLNLARSMIAGGDEDVEIGEDGMPKSSTPADLVEVYLRFLQDDLKSYDEQLAALKRQYDDEQEQSNKIQSVISQDQSFRSQLSNTQDLFDAVVDRLNEINLVDTYGGDRMEVLAEPFEGIQIAPSLTKVAAVALILGLVFGTALAWLVDLSDRVFRSADEIAQFLDAPVVGQIPTMRRRDMIPSKEYPEMDPILCTAHAPSSAGSEAYRAIRTSLYFSTSGQDHKMIQVTSPLPGDGKTTLSANLAISMARSGKRVLLIDCDFRRPSLHKLFGKSRVSIGISTVVSGRAEPEDATFSAEIENLDLMFCGPRPDNPSELLSSNQFASLLMSLNERYDFVLVDTPPLIPVTDSLAVAARVDGVILTIRIRKGVRVHATQCIEALRGVKARMLGIAVNSVQEGRKLGYDAYGYQKSYGYGYRYSYRYKYAPYEMYEYGEPVKPGGESELDEPARIAAQQSKFKSRS